VANRLIYSNQIQKMTDKSNGRIGTAVNDALHLFTNLGLTLSETKVVVNRILQMTQAQGEYTKISVNEICSAMEQEESKMDEVRSALHKIS